MRQLAMGLALFGMVLWSMGCSADTGGSGSDGSAATDGGGTDGAGDGTGTADGTTDGGATEDGTTDGGATEDGTTDEGATDTTDGGATEDGTTDGETPTGQCTNEADLAIIQGDEVDPTAEATTCGLAAIGKPPGTATPCIVEATGLSEGCAGCYGGTVDCTIANCIGACAADPSAEQCGVCMEEKGCIAAFDECAGDIDAPLDGDGTTDEGTTDEGGTDEGATDEGGTGAADFASVQPIFAARCSGGFCHSGQKAGGHDIGAENGAGGQDTSYYCTDSETTKAACAIVRILDGSMPQGKGCSGDPATDDPANCLTQEEIDAIQAWTDAGAPTP